MFFPLNFIGTWKRDEFNNTLTFTANSIRSSTGITLSDLISISGDLYTFINRNSERTFSYTIKFINGDIEISGGTTSGQGNWNGIWKKQN